MNPLDDIVLLVTTTISGAIGLMADSTGELYIFMVTWVIIALIFSMIAEPSKFGVISLVVPLPTILLMLVVAFLMEYWLELTTGWLRMMVSIGTDSSVTTRALDFNNIGSIAMHGWEVSLPIRQMIRPLGWATNFVAMLQLTAALCLVLITYGITAIMVVLGYLAYWILSLIAAIVLPFAIFNRTAFLAEGGIKYVAVTGIMLMAIAVNCGVMGELVGRLDWNPSIAGLNIFLNSCAIAIMLIVMICTPSIVAKVAGIGSVFGVGSAARSMMLAAGAAGLVGRMMSFAGSGGGGGGSGSGGSGIGWPSGMTMTGAVNPGGGQGMLGAGARQRIGSRVGW